MSCSSSTNSPLLSLWAVRLGANVDETRDAFHTALAAQPSSLPDPDPGDVAAFLRRHVAAAMSSVDPATSPRRLSAALTRAATVGRQIESGAVRIDGATFAAWQEVGDAFGPAPEVILGGPDGSTVPQARRGQRIYAGGGRRPYHRRFARFNTRTLEATEELFQSRPSRLSEEGKLEMFNRWLDKVSDVYGMERPALEYGTAAYDHYDPENHVIRLEKLSVVTLLHEFRHAMQAKEAGPAVLGRPEEDTWDEYERFEVDARAWSLSLYYQCRPQLLERLVREGRIFHLPPEDL